MTYTQEELAALLQKRSGIDFGQIQPARAAAAWSVGAHRAAADRRVAGGRVVVGKELEIRRWLSPSHLYSSAFVVRTEGGAQGIPARFTLHGAGWGHGVGFCQIGAAVMAAKGFQAETDRETLLPRSRA